MRAAEPLLRPGAAGSAPLAPLALPAEEASRTRGPRVVREGPLEADASRLRSLFRRELPAAGGLTEGRDRGSVRSRKRQAALPPVELRLFPDTVFVMQPDQVLDREEAGAQPGSVPADSGPRGRVVTGVLLAGGEGSAVLSEYEGALSASLRLSNGEFYEWELQSAGDSGLATGIVRQLTDPGRWPGSDEVVIPEADDDSFALDAAPRKAPPSIEAEWMRASTGERVITVAAYYTQRVLAARGGWAGLMAWLGRLEAESNAVLRNSQLNIEYRFVSVILAEHDDTQSTMSWSATLQSLRGVYDAAVQPRARLAAMFVAPPLPASGGSFTVGIAFLRTQFNQPQRHSVSHHLFAGGNSLTFAHEVGHNFGCVHDDANGGQNGGLYPDSRGYQQRTLEPRFYTVMAYSCSGCRAVPYYSEPNILFETIPVGSATARCAATIDREAADVSWASGPPPSGCPIEIYPSALSLGAEAQDIQVEVRTWSRCSWQVDDFPARSFVEDLGAGRNRSGPGWLRLRIPAHTGAFRRTDRLEIRGVPLTITQNGSGAPAVTPSQTLLRFDASTLPDTLQERCLFVNAPSGAGPFEVRKAGLPSWLGFDRDRVDTPDFLCVRVNPQGLSTGTHRTALRLTSNADPASPRDLLLNVEAAVSAATPPLLMVPRAMAFRAVAGEGNTAIQHLTVSGPPGLVFTPISGPTNWLRASAQPYQEGTRVDVWASTGGLDPGVYTGRVVMGCPAGACPDRVLPVHFTVEAAAPTGPRIVSGGVVNAASFVSGLSPGAWTSLFGTNLAQTTRGWQTSDFAGNVLPIVLDNVRVFVDGMAAAISFVSPGQVNFQCPELERDGWVPVEVETPQGRHRHWAWAEAAAPGVFLFAGTSAIFELSMVAALHSDGLPAAPEGFLGFGNPSRPAHPGDILSLYGTGFGPTLPRVTPGFLFQGASPLAPGAVTRVTVGGVPAPILFAGQSGAGLNQINFQVPALPPGDHPLRLVIGAAPAAWRGILRVE